MLRSHLLFAEMSSHSSHLLHQYQIGRRRFSKVMEATKNGTNYTLKIYNLSMLNASDRQGINREVDILYAIASERIIMLYDDFVNVFENTTSRFLVMEHMLGGDLFERIASRRTYDESNAREACRRILEAVTICHSRHIVHRDLKVTLLIN
jgi:serine/threonine protein kinase